MTSQAARLRSQTPEYSCIACGTRVPLDKLIYSCPKCGALLQVQQPQHILGQRDAAGWRALFDSRAAGSAGPDGSGVWRYREWVLPHLEPESLITAGEGTDPLTSGFAFGRRLGIRLWLKQCGHALSGSFKDLGMTVLISQVAHMRQQGVPIQAVICASTGDTSAALAAYAAMAGVRAAVLLPRGKISQAQLLQPMAHGARVLSLDTDFDGCMQLVQQIVSHPGIYLANSKNSLRIEGQKTVAFEIARGLGWQAPDWVVIPGGNLGNVSALVRGFETLHKLGLCAHMPRVLCAQAQAADPFFRAFENGFAQLRPVQAQPTQASAIRIGNPVSYPKAKQAIQQAQGAVASVSEHTLAATAQRAQHAGLFVCPHTAVALAAVEQAREQSLIQAGQQVVVIATAHALKFAEFQAHLLHDTVPGARLNRTTQPLEIAADVNTVLRAILEDAHR